MDHLAIAISSEQELSLLTKSISSNFLFTIFVITIPIAIVAILNIINSIYEPMDYKLDMTTKDFCKHLAEVDNSLKLRRGEKGVEMHPSSNKWSKSEASVDCATDLLSSSIESCTFESKSNSNHSTHSSNAECTDYGSTEHVYPNGWIPVMESYKVKPGDLKKAIVFGRDVIVTRSLQGEVSVLDAYCPHMGVHIGIGGRVLEVNNQSCVECPFHGWTFRTTDGQCVRIPYLKNGSKCAIPKQAKLGTWFCNEVDNFIYVWHHIDGQPPSWFLEPSKELSSRDWIFIGRSCHITNLELRDMHENGADFNHFEGIHNDLYIFGGELLKLRAFEHLQKYFRHHWSPDWTPLKDANGKDTHKAEMNLLSWISIFKKRVFDIRVRATQEGPACINLRYSSKWYGEGLLKMNAIPLGGRRTKYVQHIYTKKSLFNCLATKWVLYGEIMQLERDFFIWNHKKNIKNPMFVAEDKILKSFRKWYSQFYKRKRNVPVIGNSDSHDKIDNKKVIIADLNF